MLFRTPSQRAPWLLALVLSLACLIPVSEPTRALAQKGQKGGGFGGGTDVLIKSTPKFLEAFRPAVTKARECTVRVQCDGKDTVLGVAVSKDGFILTQLHELSGTITVKLKDGSVKDAKVHASHKAYDLALLKIEVTDLTAVEWRDSAVAPVGYFVASVGTGTDPVAVGVVSVPARKVPLSKFPVLPKAAPNSGFLGINLADDNTVAKIARVEAKSAAETAGLKVDDIVLAVGGKEVRSPEALIQTVQKYKAGETVELKIKRGEEELALKATLGKRPPNADRGEFQNNLGSELSKLRGGYPHVLQHDTVLRPVDCGSPLVDLEGNVIGINVSRAGRVETFAIPAEVVRGLLPDLLAGKSATK